jgi:hypothetical protein
MPNGTSLSLSASLLFAVMRVWLPTCGELAHT